MQGASWREAIAAAAADNCGGLPALRQQVVDARGPAPTPECDAVLAETLDDVVEGEGALGRTLLQYADTQVSLAPPPLPVARAAASHAHACIWAMC